MFINNIDIISSKICMMFWSVSLCHFIMSRFAVRNKLFCAVTHVIQAYFTCIEAFVWLPQKPVKYPVTHWGWVKHIHVYVSKLAHHSSRYRSQAIIWTNVGICLSAPMRTTLYKKNILRKMVAISYRSHWAKALAKQPTIPQQNTPKRCNSWYRIFWTWALSDVPHEFM